MRNIYTVGETTYDIIFRNNQPKHAVIGGSALNTSVSLGRLGFPVHFISRLGNDKIGNFSIRFLIDNGVQIENIVRFDGNSRISFAFMDNENNAEYQFYQASQSPSLQFPEPTDEDIISLGSTMAIQKEGRKELIQFLTKAVENNSLTIYDPNIRQTGEKELTGIRKKVEENLLLTKILKGSEQDFQRLYGTSDAGEIFLKVNEYGIKALIITAGVKPIQLITNEFSKSYPVEAIRPVSTIGAGDNFTAGIITGFYKHHVTVENINTLAEDSWDDIINIGNAFAFEVCKSEFNYISQEFATWFSECFLKDK
jgi:fructokinase